MIICEIKDMTTGCTYIREGNDVQECIKDFQRMFFIPRDYKVLWFKDGKKHGDK